ncbi:hypothetical protein [Azospirillum griseum]|uniref:Membrane protein involved in the export of O-antigen and teichoic acid n=1 Tax=Azospirillum griseum TaxID=2496639 RepID=A0A3S0K0G4_9PROT|nr:hypothetical protein [Azospirillum griseum]RTR14174.1 hypothetical protein EJ903_24120 [Azospirillum griseum]
MNPGVSRRIINGFVAQSAGTLGLVIERFGLAALFIATFGLAGYETWLETSAWCGLVSAFGFGLNHWCGNRVQEAWSVGNATGVHRQTRLAVTAAVGAAVLAGAAAVGAAAVGFGPPAEGGGVAVWLTLAVAFKTAEAFLTGVLRGCGRMALGLWIAVGGQFIMLTLSVALTALGADLSGVAAGQAVAGLMTVAALGAATRWTTGFSADRLFPVAPDRAEWRDLGARGFPYAVANLANVVNVHLVVLVVAKVDGAAAFVLARTIANFCRQIVQQFAYAAIDEATRGLIGSDPAAGRRLFTDAIRWACLAAGLVAGWLLWLGGPLVARLSHGTVTTDPALLWILAASLPATTPGLVLSAFCLFSNRGRALAAAQAAFILGLLVCLTTAGRDGAVSVAAGLTVAEWVASVWLLGRLADPNGALGFFRAAAAGTAVGVFALAIGYAAGGAAAAFAPPIDLIGMAVFSAAWAGICPPVAALLLLTAAERRWITAKCAGLIGRRRNGDV